MVTAIAEINVLSHVFVLGMLVVKLLHVDFFRLARSEVHVDVLSLLLMNDGPENGTPEVFC